MWVQSREITIIKHLQSNYEYTTSLWLLTVGMCRLAAVDKNAENVLLLRDVPEPAGRYAADRQVLMDEAESVPARY